MKWIPRFIKKLLIINAVHQAALKLQDMEPGRDERTGLFKDSPLQLISFSVTNSVRIQGVPIETEASYVLSDGVKTYKGFLTMCSKSGELLSGVWTEV